jgi:hypothetical protein
MGLRNVVLVAFSTDRQSVEYMWVTGNKSGTLSAHNAAQTQLPVGPSSAQWKQLTSSAVVCGSRGRS